VSDDERQDSLAAQAAAWVPPWERAPRTPDRNYQAAAEEQARTEADGGDGAESASGEAGSGEQDDDETRAVGSVAGGRDGAGGDDAVAGADADVAAAGDSGSGGEVRDVSAVAGDRAGGGRADSGPAVGAPEDTESIDESGLSDDDDDFDPAFEGSDPTVATSDDSAGVDAEVDLGGSVVEAEPVDVSPGPELPVPDAIEEAAETADEDDPGVPVDAPLPPEGDDAGDVFDVAADDDVSDDGEMDLPFADEVPVSDSEDDPDDDIAIELDDDDNDDERDDSREEPAAAVPGQTRRTGRSDVTIDEADLRTPEMDLPGLTDDAELAAALEAIMLVVDEPVAELQLAQILEQPTERIALMLDNLSARYTAAGHGFDLRRVAGGWRLYTRPEYAAYVERFVLDGQSVRLTQAALETLAVVAYKQPVTRSRISAIRGVNCDGVMRTLVTRGLIEECGIEGETGAHLYRTTALFLEKLGLNSVDQLPPLAPFLPDDVEEVLDATG
jgi:segregation and condensation protein B